MRMVPAGFSRNALSAASSLSISSSRGPTVAQQALARLGRRDAARGAGQQPQAEPLLQPAYRVAQRRLRHAELGRRPGEAPFARDGEEGGEVVDGCRAAFMNPSHRCMPILAANRKPIARAKSLYRRQRARPELPCRQRTKTMEIKRSGSQPSGKGPADWFTGTVRIDPLFQATDAGARARGKRHLRAGRAHRLAHPSARSDADRHRRLRPGAARGRPDRGNPAGRRRLVRAGRKALARRGAHHRHDPHRHPGGARRQGRRLDGAGQRRAVSDADQKEKDDAKAQTWKQRPRSLGHRPRLHGDELRLRPGRRTRRRRSR